MRTTIFVGILACFLMNSCKPEQGDVGPAGAKGVAGKDGANGTNGPAGDKGVVGIQGVQGDKGATGAVGATNISTGWKALTWKKTGELLNGSLIREVTYSAEVENEMFLRKDIDKSLVTYYYRAPKTVGFEVKNVVSSGAKVFFGPKSEFGTMKTSIVGGKLIVTLLVEFPVEDTAKTLVALTGQKYDIQANAIVPVSTSN